MAIDPNSHKIVLDIKYLLHQEFQNFTLDGDFNFMDENVPNGIFFYHDAKYDVNRKSSLKLFSKWHETHNGEGKFTLKIFQPEILCSVQFVRETCVFKYEENCSIYKIPLNNVENFKKCSVVIKFKVKHDRIHSLRIGAFNIQKKDLGENEEVKNQFKKTVKSFDLLLLQEVAKDKKKLPNFSEILRSINTELVSNGESPYYALFGKEYHNCERYFLLYNTKYLVCSKFVQIRRLKENIPTFGELSKLLKIPEELEETENDTDFIIGGDLNWSASYCSAEDRALLDNMLETTNIIQCTPKVGTNKGKNKEYDR
ncbi:DgyrCDS14626 [Dimorphilus gyrociliatus]|uniref:DgyrCDS14626 n=1 Tax=Dimorphilus gyrociliatus TaxID=2664684 RepID=A0A7I8WEF4_9ANNE|nr:DgyrCDS14626 [Dimorphilus gyrociliatus]